MDDRYTDGNGEWAGNDLPNVINATKVVSYRVPDIVADIIGERDSSRDSLSVTLEDVLERIYEYAKDDLACEWGHTHDLTGVLFVDADTGDEVRA